MDVSNTTCENCSTLPSSYRCGIPPIVFGVPRYVDYLQAVLMITVIIPGFLLNSFAIFLIARFKFLHQREFFFALQILVLNVVYSLTECTGIISAIAGGWILGVEMCQVVGFIREITIMTRYLFSLVLALDRIFTIFTPFWYTRHGNAVVVAMSAIIWAVGSTRGITMLSIDCFAYVHTSKLCLLTSGCSKQCEVVSILYIVITYTSGSIVPLFLYIILVRKAKKLNKLTKPALDSGPGTSSVTVRRAAQNRRTAVTFTILFVSLIVCRLPAFVTFIAIQSQLAITGRLSPVLAGIHMIITRTPFLASPAVDAIVILRNKDIHKTIRRLFNKEQSVPVEGINVNTVEDHLSTRDRVYIDNVTH